MKLMIGYVESKSINSTTETGEDPQEEWKGYFYACLLLVITVLQVSQSSSKSRNNIYIALQHFTVFVASK
jgi:hypothetical protein